MRCCGYMLICLKCIMMRRMGMCRVSVHVLLYSIFKFWIIYLLLACSIKPRVRVVPQSTVTPSPHFNPRSWARPSAHPLPCTHHLSSAGVTMVGSQRFPEPPILPSLVRRAMHHPEFGVWVMLANTYTEQCEIVVGNTELSTRKCMTLRGKTFN